MRRPFYGWIIVGVFFLTGFTESGVFQNILSIFMKPMANEFGWTRASVAGAIAFGSVCGGLLSLFIGPVLDRYGPRMVTFWGVFILSLGLVAITFVTHIWQLYLFFGSGRMIALGVLELARSVSIANWFVLLRGRAMGITGLGERLGSALLPIMVQFLILSLGWRMAWGVLGVIVFLMSGIPALLFLRHRPEELGILPDGALPILEKKANEDSFKKDKLINAHDDHLEQVWTRVQATHTKAFWMLTFLGSLILSVQGGINFHTYPFLTDQGFSETTAVLILTIIGVFGMVGSILWGMLTDRFRIQSLLTANLIGSGLIFLLFYWAVLFKFENAFGSVIIYLLAAIQGFFHGGRNPMIPVIWASFFGRRSLGSIYSLANPFYFTANAIGPVFAGLCFDLSGSYSFPFYFFVFVFFISGLAIMYVQPPKYHFQAAVS